MSDRNTAPRIVVGELYLGSTVTKIEQETKEIAGNRIKKRMIITFDNGVMRMEDEIIDKVKYSSIEGDKFPDAKLEDIPNPFMSMSKPSRTKSSSSSSSSKRKKRKPKEEKGKEKEKSKPKVKETDPFKPKNEYRQELKNYPPESRLEEKSDYVISLKGPSLTWIKFAQRNEQLGEYSTFKQNPKFASLLTPIVQFGWGRLREKKVPRKQTTKLASNSRKAIVCGVPRLSGPVTPSDSPEFLIPAALPLIFSSGLKRN